MGVHGPASDAHVSTLSLSLGQGLPVGSHTLLMGNAMGFRALQFSYRLFFVSLAWVSHERRETSYFRQWHRLGTHASAEGSSMGLPRVFHDHLWASIGLRYPSIGLPWAPMGRPWVSPMDLSWLSTWFPRLCHRLSMGIPWDSGGAHGAVVGRP